MAAPPVKSQPLHNFSLPTLKWAHKNTSSSAAGSTSHHRCRRRDSPDQPREPEPAPDSDNDTQPPNPNPSQQSPAVPSQNDTVSAAAEDGEAKPWKLRPRKEAAAAKAAAKSKKETRAAAECNEKKIDSNNNGVKSQRIRGNGGGADQRNGSRRIWISLSKEEIEEDIYAMTGGKPSRRPRKWPRNVQKQLDLIRTGL